MTRTKLSAALAASSPPPRSSRASTTPASLALDAASGASGEACEPGHDDFREKH